MVDMVLHPDCQSSSSLGETEWTWTWHVRLELPAVLELHSLEQLWLMTETDPPYKMAQTQLTHFSLTRHIG